MLKRKVLTSLPLKNHDGPVANSCRVSSGFKAPRSSHSSASSAEPTASTDPLQACIPSGRTEAAAEYSIPLDTAKIIRYPDGATASVDVSIVEPVVAERHVSAPMGSNFSCPSAADETPPDAPSVEPRKHVLIPVKRGFNVPQVLAPAVAAAGAGSADEVEPQCYSCMFTKATNKKHKTYEDGFLVANGKTCILFDTEGKQIAKQFMKDTTFRIGCSVDFGRYETEVMNTANYEDYISGRCFIKTVAECNTKVEFKTAAPRAKPRPLSDVHGPSSNAVGIAKTTACMPTPRHDPFAPNALVLQWPNGIPLEKVPGDGWCDGVPVVVDPVLTQHLRPHQREGLIFMWQCINGLSQHEDKHGCILADEMGLGKTLQTIAVLWTLLKQSSRGTPCISKAIVVCPSSLVNNWRAEFKKWLGDERCKPLAVDKQGSEAAALVSDFLAGSHTVHPVLIISYEMLRKHIQLITDGATPRIGMLICDEAHRLKSACGNKTIAALEGIPTKRRLLLTGTPVQNNLEELYAMASFANPGILGTLPTFRRVFQDPIVAGKQASASAAAQRLCAERSSELSAQISKFTLRRTSEVLEKMLPPKEEYYVFCRLTPAQAELYKAIVQRRFSTSLAMFNDAVILQLMNLLRKICAHPDLLLRTSTASEKPSKRPRMSMPDRSTAADREDMSSVDDGTDDFAGVGDDTWLDCAEDATTVLAKRPRASASDKVTDSSIANDAVQLYSRIIPAAHKPLECAPRMITSLDSLLISSKMLLVHDLMNRILENTTDKMVIVSNFTQVLDVIAGLCANQGVAYLRLDGATAADKRMQLVSRFNDPSGLDRIFLLSSLAGGVGLNLIGANRLLMFDPSWNPATDLQALARVWRDGQKKNTYLYRLFAAHTIEEKVLQRQLLKQEYAHAAGGDTASAGRRFSKSELLDLFSLDPAAASSCNTVEVMRTAGADKEWTPEINLSTISDPALTACMRVPSVSSLVTYLHSKASGGAMT